ncbi:MAG: hypothetical protein U0X91_26725 [Spirosomataceae bacterium]
MILDKNPYYLEYNPVYGCWYYNNGDSASDTFNFHRISEKMDCFLFGPFTELMDDKYQIKDIRDFPNHKNPSPITMKKEWDYFLKVLNKVNYKISLVGQRQEN